MSKPIRPPLSEEEILRYRASLSDPDYLDTAMEEIAVHLCDVIFPAPQSTSAHTQSPYPD